MRLGIIQAGKVDPALVSKHGEYPPMFQEYLRPAGPELEFRSYGTVDGELPESPHECDAWLITGSKFGTYDDQPWIPELRSFLREVRKAGLPMIGICFGHQILAEALGGRSAKSGKGWGVGVHGYTVHKKPEWMRDAPAEISFHAFHQDQVYEVPDDAHVLASSPFCEYAMLAYGDPDMPDAVSIQPHPEFGTEYARDLVALRAQQNIIPADVGDPALASFGTPVHGKGFAEWCLAYLRSNLRKKSAA